MLCISKTFVRIAVALLISFTVIASHAAKIECLGTIGEDVSSFAVQGHYIYAAGGYTLHIIDIVDPKNPIETGWIRTENWIDSLVVHGKTVYLGTDADGGVQLVDVSDPAKPVMRSLTEPIGGNSTTIVRGMGEYLYSQSSGSLLGTTWFEVHDIRGGEPRAVIRGHYDSNINSAYATDGKQIFCTQVESAKEDFVISIEDRTSAKPRKIGSLRCTDAEEIGFHYNKMTGLLTFGKEGTTSSLPLTTWANPERVWLSTDGETREEEEPSAPQPYGEYTVALGPPSLVIKDKAGHMIGQWGTRLIADIVKVVDCKAYIIGGEKMSIVDCADPGRPKLISELAISKDVRACAIENDTLFMCNESNELFTVNIADPTSPTLAATMQGTTDTLALTASGDRMYAACKAGLAIYDIKNPSHPTSIGRFDTDKPACDLATSGSLVYLMHAGALSIIDASDTAKPILRGKLDIKWRGDDEEPDEEARLTLKRLGNILYLVLSDHDGVAYDSHVKIVDATNPAAPELVGATGASCSDDEAAPRTSGSARRAVTKTTGWLLALPAGFHISNQNGHELHVFDLSDPKKPALIGVYQSIHDPYTSAFLFKDRIYKPDDDGGLLILGRK